MGRYHWSNRGFLCLSVTHSRWNVRGAGAVSERLNHTYVSTPCTSKKHAAPWLPRGETEHNPPPNQYYVQWGTCPKLPLN